MSTCLLVAWALAGRWVERATERDAGFGGSGHGVVGGQDQPLGAELAVVALVVLADDEEGVEHVLGVGTVEAVEVEHRGVELGT